MLDNPISRNPGWLSVWVHLLLFANYEEKHSFIWNGKKVDIKPGQLISGRKQLSEATGVPESTVERVLSYLENEHQIEQQKTTKYRLITILKWKEYQNMDIKTDNRRTTDGQQTDTFNNNKKDKNIKKKRKPDEASGRTIEPFINLFKEVNPMYAQLFGRSNQREASERLLKLRTFPEWEKVIAFLVSRRSDRFCPKISTPIQMEQKYSNLETYALTLKENSKSKEIVGL